MTRTLVTMPATSTIWPFIETSSWLQGITPAGKRISACSGCSETYVLSSSFSQALSALAGIGSIRGKG